MNNIIIENNQNNISYNNDGYEMIYDKNTKALSIIEEGELTSEHCISSENDLNKFIDMMEKEWSLVDYIIGDKEIEFFEMIKEII